MTATRTVRVRGGTVADVRAWLAEVDRAGLAEDSPVYVKTRPTMTSLGPKLTSIAAEGPVTEAT